MSEAIKFHPDDAARFGDAPLHGAYRDREQRRDLFVAMIAAGGEQERVTQLAWQRTDDLRDGRRKLTRHQLRIGSGIGSGELDRLVVGCRRAKPIEPGPQRAAPVDRLAPDDPHEPAAEGGWVLQGVKTRPGGDRGILDGLVRVAWLPDGRQREPASSGEVFLDQRAESSAVPGPRKCYEANDFGVRRPGFDVPVHQHRQRKVNRGHTQ